MNEVMCLGEDIRNEEFFEAVRKGDTKEVLDGADLNDINTRRPFFYYQDTDSM